MLACTLTKTPIVWDGIDLENKTKIFTTKIQVKEVHYDIR